MVQYLHFRILEFPLIQGRIPLSLCQFVNSALHWQVHGIPDETMPFSKFKPVLNKSCWSMGPELLGVPWLWGLPWSLHRKSQPKPQFCLRSQLRLKTHSPLVMGQHRVPDFDGQRLKRWSNPDLEVSISPNHPVYIGIIHCKPSIWGGTPIYGNPHLGVVNGWARPA